MSRPLHLPPTEQPLRRTQQPQHNLPLQPTPLVGRERDIARAGEMLRRPEVRLLTLTGPPGIGKTRLGIQVAAGLLDQFEHGVYFVDLAPITDYNLVIPTIAQTLGIKQAAHHTALKGLQVSLADKVMLLLLDNFEQVLKAAPSLADLLRAAPGVKIIATSREVLHLSAEHNLQVLPLSIPPMPAMSANTAQAATPDQASLLLERMAGYEAVQLFTQRAAALKPDFALTDENAFVISEICHRLDGLPLAIELAAARVRHLPLRAILDRLESKLQLLTGGSQDLPARQQTLRAAIEWSYDLLREEEKTLFRRLGVFMGGCSLQAAEAVCNAEGDLPDVFDGLASLVDKSLLQPEMVSGQEQEGARGEPRFMMLETIREYARGKLEEGAEFTTTGDRHCDYFLKFAEDAEQGTLGSEQAFWMWRLDAEHNNLRAALEWSLSANGRAEKGLRLAGALGRYWDDRGYFSEGQRWCTQLLSKTNPRGPSVERAKALRALARMTWQQGDIMEARSIYEQSLEMSRALGDESGVASALIGLASVVRWQGDDDFSRSLAEESLAIGRRLGDRHLIAAAYSLIGVILMRKEEYRAAQSPLDEALVIERELGNLAGLAVRLTMRGSVAIHLEENEKAKELIEESLGIARKIEAKWIIAFCLARLGLIALRQGDQHQAEAFLMEGLGLAQGLGLRRWSQWYSVGLAEVARLRGMVKRAAILIGISEGILSVVDAYYEPATRDEIDRIIARASAELDEESFARFRAEGRAMSLEQAMKYALEPEAGQISGADKGPQTYQDGLTEREVEVLRLIAAGKSNQEIASQLVLSLRTVERHISNIYQKIGAHGKAARVSASTYAAKHGITPG